MRKIAVILCTGIIISGCSVISKLGRNNDIASAAVLSESLLEGVKSQNISNQGYFIQKAEIEVDTQEGKQKILSSIKFSMPGEYLISLRNRTGIEGARIYIRSDSVLINDKFNKRFYSGNSLFLIRKYGVSQSFLPLLFGDLLAVNNLDSENIKCIGEKLNFENVIKGVKLSYNIDCKRRKVLSVTGEDNFTKNNFRIEMRNFLKNGVILIPKKIEFTDYQYNIKIKIKILKIEIPWSGALKFIPGKGYESIELK